MLPFEVDGVKLEATLDDMRCRYNLNALDGAEEAEQADFARLVDQAGQDDMYAQAGLDPRGEDVGVGGVPGRRGGAEPPRAIP